MYPRTALALRVIYFGGILVWALYVFSFPTWIGRLGGGGSFGLQGVDFDHRTNRAPIWSPPTGHGALIHAPIRWPGIAAHGDRIELDFADIVWRLSAGVIVAGFLLSGLNFIWPSKTRLVPAVASSISVALVIACICIFVVAVLSMGYAATEGLTLGLFFVAVAVGLAFGIWAASPPMQNAPDNGSTVPCQLPQPRSLVPRKQPRQGDRAPGERLDPHRTPRPVEAPQDCFGPGSVSSRDAP